MINPDLKKIFNAASKKNEAFVREAISVFPKIDMAQNISNKKITKLLNNKKEKL